MNPWAILIVAGMLEMVWALSLKASDGFTRLGPTVLTIVAAAGSFWLLAIAMRHLPAGSAYAVWTGIGALGVAIIGILWFGELTAPIKLIGIGLIVGGIIALKLA